MIKQWKGTLYSFEFQDPRFPVRTFRSRRPGHFIFEIQNYSELEKALLSSTQKYLETPEFSVGNEKWTMCIYPLGNEARQGKGYVSLYLRRQKVAGRNKEASVSMKFFILEQNSDEYLVIEDVGEKNFDTRGKEWGIPRALEISNFTDKNNGFLVDNTCTFGAEVFVTSSEPSYSKMTPVKTISKRIFEEVIKFSTIGDNSDSNVFTTVFDGETYNWKLSLYLNGFSTGSNTHVSLFLILLDAHKLPNGKSMFVNFQLSLKNQINGAYSYTPKPPLDAAVLGWYNHNPTKDTLGYPMYISNDEFIDPSTKYEKGQKVFVKIDFKTVFILNDAED